MTSEEFHFYSLAWSDLIKGAKIKHLRSAIKMYISMEDYEACIGIQIAINEYIYYIDIKKKLLK